MKRILLIFFLLISFSHLMAQATLDEKANDFLRSSDKLVVVISILLTIFAGLITFLVIQDRKISKLEKQFKDKLND